MVTFQCPGVVNKYAFESTRGGLGQGRTVILDKGCTSRESMRKGEEGQGGEEIVKGNSTTKGKRAESILEICGNHEGVKPKVRWDMHLNQ